MARTQPTFETQVLAALKSLDKRLAALESPAQPTVKASPKVKVAQPKRLVRVPCAREIPCNRLFLPNGQGANNHICKGF